MPNCRVAEWGEIATPTRQSYWLAVRTTMAPRAPYSTMCSVPMLRLTVVELSNVGTGPRRRRAHHRPI